MGQKKFNPAQAKFILSSPRWSDAPPSELPMVVVAGRSNVGKSSLINMILGRRNLARTSSTPGRTQLLNFFEVDEQLLLVDVPGYGYAKAPRDTVRRWSDNVRKFVSRTEGVRAVVMLLDIRRKPSADDVAFARLVREAGPELLPVITKSDKVSRGKRRKLLDEIAKSLDVTFAELLVTSAKTGEGRTELWKRLLPLMGVAHAGEARDAEPTSEGDNVRVVTIDGPSGAGKSTVARRLAQRLGWNYLDTGAMYRAVGLKADRQGVAFDDDEGLAQLCDQTRIDMEQLVVGEPARVLLDGEEVSEAIREHRVSDLASRVSARKPVRDAMAGFQRHIGLSQPTVTEGRDMGTVVFPDAAVKIYLTASSEVRARRRTDELLERGQEADYEAILADINVRDANDSGRVHAPLKPAADAHHLDTSEMDVDQVVETIAALVDQIV